MKKIIAEFKTLAEIKRIKTIMKNVHSSKSDHLPDIIRFNLNKTFAPNSVERAELHITTSSGTDVVTIAKASLTFFEGEYPFTKVNHTSEEVAKYTVLPWDLATNVGQDNLKNLINRIKENTQNLKYIIFVKTESDLNNSMTSLAGLNLSNIMAEDNTEGLISRIEELELKVQKLNELLNIAEKEIMTQKQLVTQKQNEFNNLNNQLNTTSNQKSGLQSQLDTANYNYNYYLQQYNSYYTKYNQLATTAQSIKLDVTNTHSQNNIVFGYIGANSIEIHGVRITPSSGSFTVGNVAF